MQQERWSWNVIREAGNVSVNSGMMTVFLNNRGDDVGQSVQGELRVGSTLVGEEKDKSGLQGEV